MKTAGLALALLLAGAQGFIAPTQKPSSSFLTSSTSTSLQMATMAAPSSGKLYNDKESPKVLGAVRAGLKDIVVITGASSGLGRKTAACLAKNGNYHVVMACRDVEKAKKGAFFF